MIEFKKHDTLKGKKIIMYRTVCRVEWYRKYKDGKLTLRLYITGVEKYYKQGKSTNMERLSYEVCYS